jgi:signal transduction histidine kinase/ligand-binding sensor domain-containing protein
MGKRPLLVFALLNLLLYHGAAQEPHLELVVPPKEDEWGRIKGMVQDAQGFLWLATTDDGLYKFDGHIAIGYHNDPRNPNTLANDWVESICASKEGFLLLGTFGSGLDRLDLATGRFTHYRHSAAANTLSNDTVTAIVQDKDGLFWVGTHNGLNRFDPKTGMFTRYSNDPADAASLSDNQVRVLFTDRQGTVWIGTRSPWVHDGGSRVGGLNRFDPKMDKFVRYLHDSTNPASLMNNSVAAIFEDSRGTFWVGTAGDGLHTMDRAQGTFERHLYNPAHPERLSRPALKKIDTTYLTDYINFISEDARGNIWIGTLNGINIYDPATKRVRWHSSGNKIETLVSNGFTTAYAGRDGVFWVGTWYGDLLRLNPHKTALSRIALGKPAFDFVEDSNGALWIATTQGLLRTAADGTIQTFVADKKKPLENIMLAAVADAQQNIWIGTGGGLLRFDPAAGTFSTYQHQPGNANSLLCDTVLTLAIDRNKLWIGTNRGLDVLDLKSGMFAHYTYNPNDTTSLQGATFSDEGIAEVNDILIDKAHRTWGCVGGTVNRLSEQDGRFVRYLTGVHAISIFEASDGELWAGTSAGLYRYDKKEDDFIFVTDPLKVLNRSRMIYNITEDRQKNLWLKTKKGFVKFNVKRNEASLYENNGPSYSGYELRSHILKNDEIVSGDTSGYFRFHPERLLKAKPPHIVVTGFTLLNEAIVPGAGGPLSRPIFETGEIHLKHNQNIFSFDFTNIDFTSSPGDRHLLYKLENYETKWHKADAEGTADYYNIPPGRYTFKVKAVGSNGIWGEKDLSIVIALPWWRTWWAYLMYAFLFMAAAYSVHRFQKRRLLAKERERTREREMAQAREIEKAYHQLKATQAQLIQSEKMASLGELTAGIAHEIQNPLNFINNFSETNSELLEEMSEEMEKGNIREAKTLAADVRANEQKINHHGQRADAIVKNMLLHSRASKGEKQLTDINALCDEYLRLSYHGLRAKDKTFNANLKSDFDNTIGQINVVPQEIGRVFLNLFNNAFYAVHEKMKKFGVGYEPAVWVRTINRNGSIEIEVQDNGMGISKSVQDKIFQPFFTTKPAGQGTGLGLSLSFEIIKAHGGELKVETEEGKGAMFTIQIPAQ